MILLSADIFSQQSRPNKTIVFEGQVKNKKTGKGIGFGYIDFGSGIKIVLKRLL